ncbi:NAD(P)H-dependent oxidoreductase [Myxococcaceae bacterium GXIMD 01537]
MTSQPPPPERGFLFLLASSRDGGNAELLARRAAEALPPTARVEWLRLEEYACGPFRDLRHTPEGFPELTPEARALAERTMAADELVFVTPVYWYSLPASAKQYLEHWTGWLRRPELAFRERMRGKVLSSVIAHSGEDELGAKPVIASLRLTADYMDMRWRAPLVGHGSKPGDVWSDAPALAAAKDWLLRPVAGGQRPAA